MSDEAKKLEAIGDGLLMAVARLYLRGRHNKIPYALWTRLTSKMVNNKTLSRIADAQGLKGLTEGRDSRAAAFETEITRYYWQHGFNETRVWLYSIFDKYLDIKEEARKLIDPTERDELMRQVQGALEQQVQIAGGRLTESHIERAAKQIVENLKNGNGLD